MRPNRHLLTIAAAVSLLAPVAGAQPPDVAPPPWPGLSLAFLQPTGTGTPTTPFEVWVRATLAPTADPIVLDASAPDFGLPAAYLPVYGNRFGGGRSEFVSYTQATLSSGYLCNDDTFYGACSGGPYAFVVNVDGSGQPAWHGQQTFTLLPGQSYDYRFGTLTPPPGGAPAGTYAFRGAFADLFFYGRNAADELIYQIVTLGETCPQGDPATPAGCGFSRTVVGTAIPEPATVVLLALALPALVAAARRRERRLR